MPLWSPSLSAPLSSLPPPLLLTSTASSSPASSSPSSFSRSSAATLGTRKNPSVLCRIFQEQQRHGERERAACLSSPLSTRLERRKMSNDSCHCRCSEEKGDTTHSFSFPSRALPVPRARLSDFDLGTLRHRSTPPAKAEEQRKSKHNTLSLLLSIWKTTRRCRRRCCSSSNNNASSSRAAALLPAREATRCVVLERERGFECDSRDGPP